MTVLDPLAEVRFRAMGSDCRVVLNGGSGADLAHAEIAVRRLEALWSRFDPDSEVSRLNAADGSATSVSRETLALLCRAVRAQRFTGGWFDPFMGRDIEDLGYDRDFALLTAVGPGRSERSPGRTAGHPPGPTPERQGPEPGLGVTLHPRSVRIPHGFGFDAGGIGKGFGADLVSLALIDRGVDGVLVDLGGDVRCRGRCPGDGWHVDISLPQADGSSRVESIRMADGAVATSAPLHRQWLGPDGRRHNHLMHPALGLPVGDDVASVTVMAASGWVAEALCTAVLVGGPRIGRPLLQDHGATGTMAMLDGSALRL